MINEKPLVPIAFAPADHADEVHQHLASNVGVGPECDPRVRTAVLASLAANATPTTAGQVIQYLQIKGGALQLCTVTVQPGEETG